MQKDLLVEQEGDGDGFFASRLDLVGGWFISFWSTLALSWTVAGLKFPFLRFALRRSG